MPDYPVSRFWQKVIGEARGSTVDFGLGQNGNLAATVLQIADRSWKGGPVHFGAGLLRRVTGLSERAASAAFGRVVRAGYVEIVRRANVDACEPTTIRWIGPRA